jgi:hypothetical protein
MKNSTYRMVSVSSYGNNITKEVVLENAQIDDVKQKYFKMAGNHLGVIFDRNFNDNSKHFTLPYSYNTIHIYQN